MISSRRITELKPGERVETTRVGNVRVVVERTEGGQVLWLREELDAAGEVVASKVVRKGMRPRAAARAKKGGGKKK